MWKRDKTKKNIHKRRTKSRKKGWIRWYVKVFNLRKGSSFTINLEENGRNSYINLKGYWKGISQIEGILSVCCIRTDLVINQIINRVKRRQKTEFLGSNRKYFWVILEIVKPNSRISVKNQGIWRLELWF